MLFQQGDLLIETISKLPDPRREILPDSGRYVLCEGEATGHAHAVHDPIRVYADGNNILYLASDDYFTVVHEEHLRLDLPPGLYIVRRVKQYDYFFVDHEIDYVVD